ncbi:29639_t:CDS:2 [Gigaspora margarita]|uniref:29639_t:CDS:1 n=1 Tax=Gigaspora margarita TaxID=4874 RepID=A0ABM8W3L3_GIGMA|nr:29639_t:CDS:2 [Gigaspora margarita]
MQNSIQDLTDSFAFTPDWFLLKVENFPDSLICSTDKKSSQKPPLSLNIGSLGKISNPPLVPATTHPLNHQITLSPITPTFVSKFNGNNLHITKRNDNDPLLSFQTQDKVLRKRYSPLDLNITDVMHEENDRKEPEKKKVIVHMIKASDTLAVSNVLWSYLSRFVRHLDIDSQKVSDKANIIIEEEKPLHSKKHV